ncbi:hypothetical protein HCN44_007902 [Aphidius gifuensis]|uniref:Ammonium transporter AmtB-like domain-containing protein n=1 Tax=Aphidius gifuensis TaxID=684658 RepID=A0A834XYB9_APHGI|nr:ammonium transporter Rh type B isoform X1 [Aphidius gifuensis]KAF7993399.1 hypothetical protein HCN44_007902 [Aphidius gifuensis]
MDDLSKKRQVYKLLAIELIILVLMGIFMSYETKIKSSITSNNHDVKYEEKIKYIPSNIYPMYQDVHVMIWIGFGFLMTFPKRYGQSALGFTFLIGAILIQVAMLFDGVIKVIKTKKAPLSLVGLLNADVAVAAPLISMGALLGKTTYMQLIFIGIIELGVFTINKYIGEECFMAVDAGGSMYVHAFGAYFGLAVSFVIGLKNKPTENPKSSYESDIFAMIGTIFLWLFWPSFNSASLQGDDQQRAIINTLLGISASCVVSFAVSALVSNENKFNMVHIQNSTLAGGVAIGTAANMMCEPVGALAIGSLAGALSVVGYKYLSPIMQNRLKIHDTCGIHNLHGMPAIMAGLFGVIMAAFANEKTYNESLYQVFPARAPSSSNERLAELRDSLGIEPGFDRTAGQQALFQFLALCVTLANAIVSGLVTGLILRNDACGSLPDNAKFNDGFNWELGKDDDTTDDNLCKTIDRGTSRIVEQVSMSHI